jgi:hypothetical protein
MAAGLAVNCKGWPINVNCQQNTNYIKITDMETVSTNSLITDSNMATSLLIQRSTMKMIPY